MISPAHGSPFQRRAWGWLVVLCCLLSGPCLARNVVLHLRNGDRITGRLISETTNEVVLATAFSERLAVAKGLIRKQAPESAATKHKSTNIVAQPKPPPTPASGVVGELVLTNKPSMAQTAGGAAKPPAPSTWKKFVDQWNGEAQVGANLGFSTKDRKAVSARIKVTHNHSFEQNRVLRNILGYDTSYGTTDGVLADNRMEGTWKAEYDLNKRFLLYNSVAAGYNEIRSVDLEYEFGPGLGYKWFTKTNFVFKTELGGDYQQQYYINDRNESRYSLRVAEDFWWQITPKIKWDQRVEFFPQVEEFGDYRVRFESNLSYLLKQNLTLTFNITDLYDTSVPEGVSKNDLQIRSLLGIKF